MSSPDASTSERGLASGPDGAPGPELTAAGGHRAAKRALEIIEHVAAAPQPVSLSELARQVGLPKSSAHALARTLDDEGYLDRDERGAYALGPRLLRLLGRLPHQFELPRVARPVMQELVDEIGETAILGVQRGSAILYVEQIEAPQFIRYVAPLGEPRPLHCTSIGKVHLAAMPESEAAALLRTLPLDAFTVYTKTAPEAILSELSSVRAQGFALNREESMASVTAIAAPVREGGSADGRLVAGLSLAGPSDRMAAELSTAPERLTSAARRIGAGIKSR